MAHAALLPERHSNRDFFIADIFDALPVKNDRHSMEHPFFTLSTKRDLRIIKYDRNGVNIKVTPHHELGLPTMFDKDILLYCGSLVVAELNKSPNDWPPQTLRFSCHDLMVTTNRMTNGQAYKQLKNAFERLKGCSVTTDIKTAEVKEAAGFGLIESWRIVEKSHDNSRMVKVEVKLSDWYYRALIGREVLTISRTYFRLRKPLERRLYELARKHCGKQKDWSISLKKLQEKCGSKSPEKKFRFLIREIIKTHQSENHFPDYDISLSENDVVTFTNQEKAQREMSISLLPDSTQSLMETIKPVTIEKAASIVDRAGTGWDFNAIVEEFAQFLTKKGATRQAGCRFYWLCEEEKRTTAIKLRLESSLTILSTVYGIQIKQCISESMDGFISKRGSKSSRHFKTGDY